LISSETDFFSILWINYYLCNQCLSPLKLWVRTLLMARLIVTTLCDKVCQWLATGRWLSPGTQLSSTNKIDRHGITEILLKVELNNINQPTYCTCNQHVDIWIYRVGSSPNTFKNLWEQESPTSSEGKQYILCKNV
jgi:hypothetical protein